MAHGSCLQRAPNTPIPNTLPTPSRPKGVVIWHILNCLGIRQYTKWRRQWHRTPVLFCLENVMDGGAWWAAVHGVAKGWTRLSNFTFTFHFHALEKEMATHSSVLAWRIPGTGEPGGLPSLGSHRVGHDWSDLAATAAAAVYQDHHLWCLS